ncbi:hypothetical protein Q8A73_005785 [Channa argus]|nr:hypothetical protein Q8A73_005785 [Channa argus]
MDISRQPEDQVEHAAEEEAPQEPGPEDPAVIVLTDLTDSSEGQPELEEQVIEALIHNNWQRLQNYGTNEEAQEETPTHESAPEEPVLVVLKQTIEELDPEDLIHIIPLEDLVDNTEEEEVQSDILPQEAFQEEEEKPDGTSLQAHCAQKNLSKADLNIAVAVCVCVCVHESDRLPLPTTRSELLKRLSAQASIRHFQQIESW